MRTQTQKGHLFKASGWWFVRYRDWVGSERVQVATKLAPVAGETRSKDSHLLDQMRSDVMARVNATRDGTAKSLATIREFVVGSYLPMKQREQKRSGVRSFMTWWEGYILSHIGHKKLRDFTTPDVVEMLDKIRQRNPHLSRGSLDQIKWAVSGIFEYARLTGAYTGVNPVRSVPTPKTIKKPREIKPYTMEEIVELLKALEDRAKLAVAVAAFTGLRQGEIQGLKWEHFSQDLSRVDIQEQGTDNGEDTSLKSPESKATLPVIPVLRRLLEQHRNGWQTGYVLRTWNNGWVNLQDIAKREIRPTIERLNLGTTWRGWHAFRHGLATNLNALGVDPKTMQQLLRHANVTITLDIYTHALSEKAVEAMEKFSAKVEAALASAASGAVQ